MTVELCGISLKCMNNPVLSNLALSFFLPLLLRLFLLRPWLLLLLGWAGGWGPPSSDQTALTHLHQIQTPDDFREIRKIWAQQVCWRWEGRGLGERADSLLLLAVRPCQHLGMEMAEAPTRGDCPEGVPCVMLSLLRSCTEGCWLSPLPQRAHRSRRPVLHILG